MSGTSQHPLVNSLTNSALATEGAKAQSNQLSAGATSTPQQSQPAPPEATYDELFYHVNFLKKKAVEKDQHGEDSTLLHTFYKRQAKLKDKQNDALNKVAADVEREVSALDKKAENIIRQFRATVQGMRLKPGEALPDPPEELKAMEQERSAVILRARDALRTSLGEQGFAQLDSYVQQNIAPKIRTMRLDRPRPNNPNRPR
jgi:hypothetical protein